MLSIRLISKSLVVCAALVAVSSPSHASTVFNFPMTSGGGSSTSGKVFNVTVGTITVKVRVTAWSMSGTSGWNAVTKGGVNVYTNGLGVTSTLESSGSPHHTTDNLTNRDFLIFQFDQPVELESAKFTAYNMTSSNRIDGDATIARGTSSNWMVDPLASISTYAQLATLFNNGFESSNVNSNGPSVSIRTLNPGNMSANTWLIGAAFVNPNEDCKSGSKKNQPCLDGFKLSQVSVLSAVPEPSTWMMMLIGFGFVGFAMRQKGQAGRLVNA
jgi:PEP-CTERM motif